MSSMVLWPLNVNGAYLRRIARMMMGTWWMVLLMGLILPGCGPSEKSDSSLSSPVEHQAFEAEETTSPPATTDAEVSLGSLGLEEKESAADRWPSEVFHEQVVQQFDRWKTALKKGASMPEDLVTPVFSTDRLRPNALETVFDGARFRVQRRGAAGSTEAAVRLGTEALAEMSLGYVEGSIEALFKVFHVEDDGERVKTRVWANLSGETSDGWLQESSTWVCHWTREEKPRLEDLKVETYESTLARDGAKAPPFSDCTESVFAGVTAYHDQLAYGIDHWIERVEATFGINVSGWEGVALGDVNGDGLDDVYLCQPGGLPNRLFISKPDGTVFDGSSFAGVDWRIQTQSALLVDLDNDGDQDLALATTLGVILMANDGRGTFTVKASELLPEAAPMGLSAADVDLDGDLDLYAACYSRRRSDRRSTILGRPVPYHDANNGGRNVLLRNDRNWTFRQATKALGLDANNRRFSFASSWEDYDNDGDPDLYVANDYGRNNLYRNDREPDGSHRFVDVAREAGVEDISAGMSVSWGDYNQDGWMDLYVSNMWSSAGNRVAYQRQFQSEAEGSTLSEMRRHARGNSLFMNSGDGTFRDVSVEQGVTLGRWAWGSRFIDLNTDGREDLLVLNGFITQPEDTGDL